MSWKKDLKHKVKKVEEDVEGFVPRLYAAKLKVFLDIFLPYALILLGSLVTLNFFGNVDARTAQIIHYLNWLLVSYFILRFAAAFRLAESDREFLKNHWFDALLVIPAFSLIQELRVFQILDEIGFGEKAASGALATRNAGIAAQITKIVKIIKRSISF